MNSPEIMTTEEAIEAARFLAGPAREGVIDRLTALIAFIKDRDEIIKAIPLTFDDKPITHEMPVYVLGKDGQISRQVAYWTCGNSERQYCIGDRLFAAKKTAIETQTREAALAAEAEGGKRE